MSILVFLFFLLCHFLSESDTYFFIIAKEPQNGEYYYLLGQVYDALEKTQKSLEMYLKASEYNNRDGINATMMFCLLNNDLVKAEEYAQKLVAVNERAFQHKAKLVLAICMADRGENVKAEEVVKTIDNKYLSAPEMEFLHHYYLGLLYKKKDRLGAIECFEKVVQSKNEKMSLLATLQIAQIYIENKDIRNAVARLKNSGNKNIIKIALAKIYLSEGRNYEGIKLCEEAIAQNPNINDIQKIVTLLSQYNEADAVHKIAKNGLDVFPEEEFLDMVLADIYMKKKMWVLAEKHYYQALQNSTSKYTRAKLLFLLGRIAVSNNQYDEAIVQLKKAIAENDKEASAYLLLAEVHIYKKEYEKALGIYNQCLTLFGQQDNGQKLRLQIISTYSLMNKWDIVQQQTRELLNKNPEFSEAKIMYAMSYQKLNQHNKAITLYKELMAQTKGQETGVIANNLASSLADNKLELDYAEELAKKAWQILQVPQTLDTLAWVYYQQGKYQESKDILEKILPYNKKSPYLNYHYGLVLLQEKNPLAKQHFQTIIDESDHTFKHYTECQEILRKWK